MFYVCINIYMVVWVCKCCVFVCTCVCVYECISVRVYLYSCEYMCLWLYITARRPRSYNSDLEAETRTLPGLMLLWSQYAMRFKDRLTRWFGDSYLFVQWRPGDNSDPKSCYFMWVFVLMLFPYLLLPVGVRISIHIISCDRLVYFTSIIMLIISWDINEYPF